MTNCLDVEMTQSVFICDRSDDDHDDDDDGEPEEKQIVVLNAPLAKILRDPRHLEIYRDTVKSINRVVYLLTRYIFVHAFEEWRQVGNQTDT